MASTEGQATTADGLTLRTRHWSAAGPTAPWATVLLVHGLGEHSGRYEHVGTQLAAAGLDVHAYDQRGQGFSGGRRGDVERWSAFHDDLAARLEAVRVPGRPLVLYGHSMGGLVVGGFLLSEGRPRPDLVVLGSPWLDATLPRWKTLLAPFLGRLTPTLEIPNDIDGATLSRDPGVAARTILDPGCVKVSTTRFGVHAFAEQARIRRLAPGGLGVPTLVLHGEDDGLVPVRASAVFEGAPLTERRTYPGLRHELHNEPEGPRIVGEVIDWLRAHV